MPSNVKSRLLITYGRPTRSIDRAGADGGDDQNDRLMYNRIMITDGTARQTDGTSGCHFHGVGYWSHVCSISDRRHRFHCTRSREAVATVLHSVIC